MDILNTLAQAAHIREAHGQFACNAPYCIVRSENGDHEGPHTVS